MTNRPEVAVYNYNRIRLPIYRVVVLGFSNTFVWRCPTRHILEFYNQHITGNHLDAGVGTGFFLDNCQYPTLNPRIALVDLNPIILRKTVQRLQRYQLETYQADVLEPLSIPGPGFDSIAANYLLHCLPGTMRDKSATFQNLKQVLNDGGCVFGSTILGQGVRHNFLARAFLNFYHKKGYMSTTHDSPDSLREILSENFSEYSVHTVGCVAFFVCRN